MKFETPVVEVKKFSFEDILTTSAAGSTEPPVADGIYIDGGVCKGTAADYWEDNCPAY